MSGRQVLWIDLRLTPHGQGLAHAASARWSLVRVTSLAGARAALHAARPALVGVEFDYPHATPWASLPGLVRLARPAPVLVFTEYHSEALAVQAFRWGVWDYRVKPVARSVLQRDIALAMASTRPGQSARTCGGAMPPDLAAVERHLPSIQLTARRTAAASTYIAGHCVQAITRGALARACHLSESEFTRVFRREHGSTFERYLVDVRVSQARGLLAASPLTITQVAHAVGFNDAAYFARVFRRVAGMTASTWRRLAQGGAQSAPATPHRQA